jgi:hypothetical protein
MSLKYEGVLFNYASFGYVDNVQKTVNKGSYDTTKVENGKMHLYFNM